MQTLLRRLHLPVEDRSCLRMDITQSELNVRMRLRRRCLSISTQKTDLDQNLENELTYSNRTDLELKNRMPYELPIVLFVIL